MNTPNHLTQLVAALAFAGDISMGQPTEHSPRVTLIALQLAQAIGLSKDDQIRLARLALLRWAGCTANAHAMANFLGDDIHGRAEWVAGRSPFIDTEPPNEPLSQHIAPLAHSHCEAMTEISQRAGIDFGERLVPGDLSSLPKSIADLFEYWDGSGSPSGRQGDAIDPLAQITAIASDIEAFSRHYGIEQALTLIDARSGKHYNPAFAQTAITHAEQWLDQLTNTDVLTKALACAELSSERVTLSVEEIAILLSDYAALKHPDSMRLSRLASAMAEQTAKHLGFSRKESALIKRATLLHRLGFVSVSNKKLQGYTDNESDRLAPYWTQRILKQAPVLEKEAELASMSYECLDGSGYYRGLTASHLSTAARIVQVAVAAATLRVAENQPKQRTSWQSELTTLGESGRLDIKISDALIASQNGTPQTLSFQKAISPTTLTKREKDVMGLVTQGLSNKEIARTLKIAPKTVSAHLENIYRKLMATGRTAATMKALEYGFL